MANAPIGRAWPRPGYLVLCRPHPDRVKPSRQIGVHRRSGVAGRMTKTCSSTNTQLARTLEGAPWVGGKCGGDWVCVDPCEAGETNICGSQIITSKSTVNSLCEVLPDT